MGKALRPEHLNFFYARMNGHSRVLSWGPIPDQHEYLFRITRILSGSRSDILVHLTDAYRYGLAEFYSRPGRLKAGSYIVIAMPHANAAAEVIEIAKEHRIGIGKIRKFMGALNAKNTWEYMTPEERRQKEEQARREAEE